MKRTNKYALAALAVSAAMGLAGCATAPAGGLAIEPAAAATAPAQVAADQRVIRALPSYGSMGGYRYRRFAAVSTAG